MPITPDSKQLALHGMQQPTLSYMQCLSFPEGSLGRPRSFAWITPSCIVFSFCCSPLWDQVKQPEVNKALLAKLLDSLHCLPDLSAVP